MIPRGLHWDFQGFEHQAIGFIIWRVYPKNIWGFPKFRGTILGVPIIRIIVFWGLYWGPLILGNYHIGLLTGAMGFYEWVPFKGSTRS